MPAVRFVGAGHSAHIADVPKSEPRSGEVVIRIGGAGVCHSDRHVVEEDLGFRGEFRPGHENAGWVAQVGRELPVTKKATRSPSMARGL